MNVNVHLCLAKLAGLQKHICGKPQVQLRNQLHFISFIHISRKSMQVQQHKNSKQQTTAIK